MTVSGGVATVRLQVVDRVTGEPVAASVEGRFTKLGGRYLTMTAGLDGRASGVSEGIGAASGQIGFQPLRITAPGYQWASAYDRARDVEVTW